MPRSITMDGSSALRFDSMYIKEEQRVLFHINYLNLCTKEEQEAALEVCRKIKGILRSDVFERRTSTGSVLFALLSRDFEPIRDKTHNNTTNLVTSTGSVLVTPLSCDFEHRRKETLSNTTNLVAPRHIARKKVHFQLTCVAENRRCLNCLETMTVGKHLPAPFITLPLLPTFLSTQRNRELKQQRRQRPRKSHLKSEFALPQILSRL